MRDARKRGRRDANLVRDFLGRVIRQSLGPTLDCGYGDGGTQLLAQNHVRQAQGEYAFRSRLAGNPFVGVGGRLRQARLDVNELAALAGTALRIVP